MSEPIEAYPEAAAILRDAGWLPHNRWGVYTRGSLVMGFSPDGQHFDVKNWGLDAHGPDTPDDPVEAAQWLVNLRKPVAPAPEPEQTPGHEGDGDDPPLSSSEGEALPGREALAGDDGGVAAEQRADDVLATEPGALDLGAEVLEEHADEFAGPQFVFGDNLDQMRTAAIGLVVRISRSKQAEIAALMGGHDFAAIQGAVMRDTQDGQYKGPQATYDLFVELSRHQNAINRVKATEADKVAFLEHASREEVEAFDPEQGWPK